MENKILPVIHECEWGLIKIIWEHQGSIKMRKLIKEGYDQYGWARTTIYTMVKRMSDRGILVFDHEIKIVYAKYTKDEYRRDKLRKFVTMYYDSDGAACRKDLE